MNESQLSTFYNTGTWLIKKITDPKSYKRNHVGFAYQMQKRDDQVSFEDYKSRLFMLVQFFKYPASLALLPDASLQTGETREELGSPVLRVRLLVRIGPESRSASFRVLLPVAVLSVKKKAISIYYKLFFCS